MCVSVRVRVCLKLSFLTESVKTNTVINESLKWIKAALASALLLDTKSFSGRAEQYATLSRLSDTAIYQSAAATLTSANLIETDLADREPHGRTIQSHSSASAPLGASAARIHSKFAGAALGRCSFASEGKLIMINGKVMNLETGAKISTRHHWVMGVTISIYACLQWQAFLSTSNTELLHDLV